MIQAEDRAVGRAVEAEAAAIVELVERVTARLRRGGRLFYVGAGTSGRLGVLDAAEVPPTFGTDPGRVRGIIAGGPEALVRSREGAEDDVEAGRDAIREADIGADDFVLGIAASGTTPFVAAALEEAAARGAGIGFLSCTEPPPRVRELAEVRVTTLVGPEVIAGSTRMKAGTATKLVLNTLTTAVMARSGKVYRNLMVDLRAVSLKLVERSLRIVQAAAEVGRERARELLVAAGGSAKTAIAMERLGANRYTAERLLAACEGFLGEALERWGGAALRPEYACWPAAATSEERELLLRQLASFPDRLHEAVSDPERTTGASPAAERTRESSSMAVRTGEGERARAGTVPPSSRWSAAEHVAHLLAFESEAVRPRLERLREHAARRPPETAGGEGERVAFRSWEAGFEGPAGGRDAITLAARFASERRRSLFVLPDPDAGGFDLRFGIGREHVTLDQFLRGVAFHDEAHLLRIEERVHPALLAGDGRESARPGAGGGR